MSEEKKERKPRDKAVVILGFKTEDSLWNEEESFESTAAAIAWLKEHAMDFAGQIYRISTIHREGELRVETVEKTKVTL